MPTFTLGRRNSSRQKKRHSSEINESDQSSLLTSTENVAKYQKYTNVVYELETAVASAVIVSPESTIVADSRQDDESITNDGTAQFNAASSSMVAIVTPSKSVRVENDKVGVTGKRKLIFGRLVEEKHIPDNVRRVYSIVRKYTGSLGGNASMGPIYGELTMGSMQKVVDYMKQYTNFCKDSMFIDVGSGIGKPNLHVAQDPGVAFSYGIEVESSRWLLSAICLKAILQEAETQDVSIKDASTDSTIEHKCYFDKRDIRDANSFDPFTHVYMFSIGFPPSLWLVLADMWNRSVSEYLVCYHSPRDIINNYEFDVELITQTPTSMHGSKEGHTCYFYRRTGHNVLSTMAKRSTRKCDKLYSPALDLVNAGLSTLKAHVDNQVDDVVNSGLRLRGQRSRSK